MKKKLLFVLPFISLVGCNATSNVVNPSYELTTTRGLPTVKTSGNATHITYLMMSKYGRLTIDGNEIVGKDYAEKYLENVIIWESEDNGELPKKESVSSTVKDAVFRGWVRYNDNTYPEYLTTVPKENESIVSAIFDGPTGGGGSGGEESNLTYTVNNLPSWIFDDSCIIFAWAFGGGAGAGIWVGLDYTDTSHTAATFETYNNIDAFLLVRCIAGTQIPNWDERNDVPGRIYNQTNDILVSSSQTRVYGAPNEMWKEYKK